MRGVALERIAGSLVLVQVACADPAPPDPDDTALPTDTDADTDTSNDTDTAPAADVLRFTEIGQQAGLNHQNRPGWQEGDPWACGEADVTVAGVAVGDWDGDGLDDLFFPVYQGPDRLYRNRGDGTFVDVTADSGLPEGPASSSAVFTDLDGDGRLDLVVGRLLGEPLRAYVQASDGTFTDQTAALGLRYPYPADACSVVWSLSLGDADNDGDIDLLMGAWRDKLHDGQGFGTLLWRRGRDGTFAAQELPLPRQHYGFTPAVADLDQDGLADLPIASDFETNLLLWGQPDGSFVDGTRDAGVHTVEAGMGSALLDLDADGDLDWLVTSVHDARDDLDPGQPHLGNMAYLNQGDRTFVDGARDLGLDRTGWAWGVAVADLDLDGLVELVITNGYDPHPGAAHLFRPFHDDPTALLHRDRAAGPFVDIASGTGLEHTGQGRAIVPLDLVNDGDEDLLIVNQVGRPSLFRNDLRTERRRLSVRLRQDGPNPHALGSQVWIQRTPDSPSLRYDVHGNATFLSQVPPRVRVGLGPGRTHAHRVRVVWPDGQELVLQDVEAGERVVTP